MLAVFLIFVGASLAINGAAAWQSTVEETTIQPAPRDVAVVNLFTGALGAVIISLLLADGADPAAAYIGLFALTYLWVGINHFTGADGTALGWFSLVVALIAVPAGIASLLSAATTFDVWIGINWFAWSILWFLFFLGLGLHKPLARTIALVSVAEAMGTALVPAMLVLTDVL